MPMLPLQAMSLPYCAVTPDSSEYAVSIETLDNTFSVARAVVSLDLPQTVGILEYSDATQVDERIAYLYRLSVP